jgi:hypothetical protein
LPRAEFYVGLLACGTLYPEHNITTAFKGAIGPGEGIHLAWRLPQVFNLHPPTVRRVNAQLGGWFSRNLGAWDSVFLRTVYSTWENMALFLGYLKPSTVIFP